MIEVVMPQLGESVAEGTVTQWHVKPGDYVKQEQPLLEVATDKADSEVPSPTGGVVVKVVAAEGDVIPTGGLLCTIDETAEAGEEASPATAAARRPRPSCATPSRAASTSSSGWCYSGSA